MSRVSNIMRNLHPGCMWGKQRGPESVGRDAWRWSRWRWQGFLIAKVTLQMQSSTAAGEPEILYQLLRGKAFVLERDASGRVYIWVIIFDSVCVHQISQLNSRASAEHFRQVLRSPDHWGPDLLPWEVKGKVPFLGAEDRSLDSNSWTYKLYWKFQACGQTDWIITQNITF